MISFKSFLKEGVKHSNINVTNLENLPFHHGHAGISASANALEDFDKQLQGKTSTTQILSKYYGKPIIFGKDKKNPYFVAHDDNKNIMNQSHEDIDKNYGDEPKTSSRLKNAYDHLHKIIPKDGGIFKGSIIHSKGDIKNKNDQYHTTPGDITYSTDKNSSTAKRMKNSHIGVSVDSIINNGVQSPLTKKERSSFIDHPDVHNINPTLPIDPKNYTPDEQKNYLNNFQKATMAYRKMQPETPDIIEPHLNHILDYMSPNKTLSTDDYIKHLNDNQKEHLINPDVLNPDKSIQKHGDLLKHVVANKNHFDSAFDVHNNLKAAKNDLMDVADKNQLYDKSIKGKDLTNNTYHVIDKDGNQTKFSRS